MQGDSFWIRGKLHRKRWVIKLKTCKAIFLKATVLTRTSKTTPSPTGQLLGHEFTSCYHWELRICLLLSTTITISFVLFYRSCTFVSLCNKVKAALKEPQTAESCFKSITKNRNSHINNTEKRPGEESSVCLQHTQQRMSRHQGLEPPAAAPLSQLGSHSQGPVSHCAAGLQLTKS